MILWVMPDSGARTKEDYAALVSLFKQENPSVDVTVRVFTRNVLWRRMFTIKHRQTEYTILEVDDVPDPYGQLHHYEVGLI